MSSDEFAFIELPLIEPSLTNPRKNFNEAKLRELADSIRASGVHQPILVRKLPGARVAETSFDPNSCRPRTVKPVYEIVSGERRYRASKLAGAPTIPALIRDLSDDQVLEVQIIENLQRDDLTELEEAEGYEALMQHSGLSADQVGVKIGKSRSYVYGRLKLLDLALESKQALREGKIDASRALLIARIPDGKLQLKALGFATEPSGYPPEPPSVRRLQDWLKANVMLRLDQAIFKLTDVRLVEEAGSCTTCPKRTGANPDLFTDVESADICTDPACYHGKEEAHRARLVKKAEGKGMRIVQDKEAIELMEGNQYRPLPAGYVDLGTQRPDLSQESERPMTLGQVLGKDAPSPILFIHPRTQEVSELVPAEEAEAVLLAKGLIKAETLRAEKLESLEDRLEYLKCQVERETERSAHQAIHAATAEAIRHSTPEQAKRLLVGEVLRAYLMAELDSVSDDDMARMLGYEFQEGEDENAAITGHIQRLGDTELLRAVALCFLDRDACFYRAVGPAPLLDAFVKELGIDTKALRRAAMAEVKKEHAKEIGQLQAEIDAQKAPPATGSAARPKEGPGGRRGEDRKAPGKRPAAPAVLSAREATQGIAAAMQGLEAQASADAVAPDAQPEGGDSADSEGDLYGQAVAVVAREQKASKRLLKEALGIGQWRGECGRRDAQSKGAGGGMSRSKKPRKAYRPRQIAINTLELAIHRAAKPPRQDLDEILEGLDAAIQALCAGVATELQWSIVAGAAALAKAIERQGVVRGLQEHLDSAEAVLQAVYGRCRLPALWLRPTLTFEEIEAVQLLRELHAFQIEQLGRGEFLRAVDAATRLIVSEGNQVTLMRDIEEVAA